MNILAIIIVFATDCGNQCHTDSKIDNSDTVVIKTQIDTTEISKQESEIFKNINYQLYNRLINGNYGPFASKNSSGYYSLDLELYFAHLDRIGIFSEIFKDNEKKRTKECAEDLEQLKYMEEPGTGWAPNSCARDYMYWLKSNQSSNGYEIKELTLTENIATAKMSFFDNFKGKRSSWSNILDIKYRKEDGYWKITNIIRLK